jgi:hypothetical protein
VTLVGLSKNHAMTIFYPATTRQSLRPGLIHHSAGRNRYEVPVQRIKPANYGWSVRLTAGVLRSGR